MNIKKLIIIFFISLLITSCQTIKEKSDAVAEKENKEYGKFEIDQNEVVISFTSSGCI